MSGLRRSCVEALDAVMDHARRRRDLDLQAIADLAHEVAGLPADDLLAESARAPAGRHPVDVALLAAALFPAFLETRVERAAAVQAALLHDVGLALAGDRRHPEMGADLLLGCRDVPAVAVEAAYCHHMRGRGRGFPVPRTGLRPGPVTQVITVADLFVSLTRRRRRPFGAARAIRAILRLPGMESRQDAIALLVDLPAIWPGSLVRLGNGEEARLVAPGVARTRSAMVDLGSDPDGIDCVLLSAPPPPAG